MKLFLDDKRKAPKGFVLVRSARACIRALAKENVRVISLDYNLGKSRPKGYRVVLYMVRKRLFPPAIIIHSNSRRGRKRMCRLLKRRKPRHVTVTVRPLPSPH